MLIMPNAATPAPPNCYCSESRAHKRMNQLNFLTDELCIKAAQRARGCTVGEEFLCVCSHPPKEVTLLPDSHQTGC